MRIQLCVCMMLGAILFTGRVPASAQRQGKTLYVSTAGNNDNPGTHSQPLASLTAARDAARAAGGGPHRIVILPGQYFLAEPFVLDTRDNGLTLEADTNGIVILYGGMPVTGWRRDGDRFWCADVPGVAEGKRDIRSLVVNGRMPLRARLPESGTFTHKSVFNIPNLFAKGGHWQRDPTPEESTTLLYDPADIPTSLDIRNVEVEVFHSYTASLVGVARNDTQRHAIIFSKPTSDGPPGAYGVQRYTLLNIREGMTHPGQWYLDRSSGRVVYWPLPEEDPTTMTVIVPAVERILHVAGSEQQMVEGITIRGLTLQAATVPMSSAGFGGTALPGALSMDWARQCTVEKVEICNVGGVALKAAELVDSYIRDCHVHHVGAGGLGITGSGTAITRNHIHDVGIYYPSAAAMLVYNFDEKKAGHHIYRNEIHDVPYSGMICSRFNMRIEENIVYRVMRVLHDGAAIYGGMRNSIIRGNIVRDVVEVGTGYGASGYYLDEGAENTIVERNIAIGVPTPYKNHIARKCIARDNTFITDNVMRLLFNRSSDCIFENNTLYAPGGIDIRQPTAITVWKDNLVIRDGLGPDGATRPFLIGDAMPPVSPPTRKSVAVAATRVAQPPVLDGDQDFEHEWTGPLLLLDRVASRDLAGGPGVFAKLSYDDRCLYVAVIVTTGTPVQLSEGTTWGKDDGVELSIAGKDQNGKPTVFVIRCFSGGAVQSVTEAGAPGEAANRVEQAVRAAVKSYVKRNGGGWRGEWAIPLDSLGLRPASGDNTAFNLVAYRSLDQQWRWYEGTFGESWHLDQAGLLRFE